MLLVHVVFMMKVCFILDLPFSMQLIIFNLVWPSSMLNTFDVLCYALDISFINHLAFRSRFVWFIRRKLKATCRVISQQLKLTYSWFVSIWKCSLRLHGAINFTDRFIFIINHERKGWITYGSVFRWTLLTEACQLCTFDLPYSL